MKRILAVGGAGFVGRHLAEVLSGGEYELSVTKRPGEKAPLVCGKIYDVDILNREAVVRVMSDARPDAVIHLAAQSSVARSWEAMDMTFDVNVKGTVHLLEAVREVVPSARVLVIGSAEEYGGANRCAARSAAVGEDTPLCPKNPYAVSKAAQTMIAHVFGNTFGMDVICMRAFNHIGAGQARGFAVPDFCRQIALIERGDSPPIIRVGNLSARRDFSDVRDIVRGYMLALRSGVRGRTYNIGSGTSRSVRSLLDMLISLSGAEIRVEIDPEKFRPSETPEICADITLLQNDTGYKPMISITKSLQDALNYERERIKEDETISGNSGWGKRYPVLAVE